LFHVGNFAAKHILRNQLGKLHINVPLQHCSELHHGCWVKQNDKAFSITSMLQSGEMYESSSNTIKTDGVVDAGDCNGGGGGDGAIGLGNTANDSGDVHDDVTAMDKNTASVAISASASSNTSAHESTDQCSSASGSQHDHELSQKPGLGFGLETEYAGELEVDFILEEWNPHLNLNNKSTYIVHSANGTNRKSAAATAL
jgi:hypothetical protein